MTVPVDHVGERFRKRSWRRLSEVAEVLDGDEGGALARRVEQRLKALERQDRGTAEGRRR